MAVLLASAGALSGKAVQAMPRPGVTLMPIFGVQKA
jgi:hypothetical protein